MNYNIYIRGPEGVVDGSLLSNESDERDEQHPPPFRSSLQLGSRHASGIILKSTLTLNTAI